MSAAIVVISQQPNKDRSYLADTLDSPLTLYQRTPPHGSSMPGRIEEHTQGCAACSVSARSANSEVRMQRAVAVSVKR